MNRMPLKIKNCPIEEAVFEIRFSSVFPSEAVFGIFYQILNQNFPGATLIPQPILQLPEAVRQSDPNLIYQAHYRLQLRNQGISIGPKVLVFSNQKPYMGWAEWSSFIDRVLRQLISAKAFETVERTGLRYINFFFEQQLFNIANVEVKVIESQLVSQSTTLRSEILDQGFIKVLQLANNVNITSGVKSYMGSALDIDVLKNLGINNDDFGSTLSTLMEESHTKEKELFFNLLKKDYVETLLPIYEVSNG